MGSEGSPSARERHTFIFADLAGYTALTEAHGDEQAADVAAEFCAAVRPLLPDYGGEEVKAIGDALLIRVTAPGPAIHLASRLAGELGASHRSLGVRVGMHTGTAVQRGGDWFGAAVNLAARVADVAAAGEVVMSAATREAAAGDVSEEQLRSRGPREFKNVSEPVELFVLELDPAGGRSLPIDPVCRMAVAPDRCEHHLVHAGAGYHFCSAACEASFSAHPERYTRQR